MLHLKLNRMTLYLFVVLMPCIVIAGDSEIQALRETLLQKDITTRYGLWVPKNDPRLKAIKKLQTIGAPEAVAALLDFLTVDRINC